MLNIAPQESYSNTLLRGNVLTVSGQALVTMDDLGTTPVPDSGTRRYGPYLQERSYRIDAITPVTLYWSTVPPGAAMQSLGSMPWAELMARHPPQTGLTGHRAWCTDAPAPSGLGAEMVCSGSRWHPLGGRHCLLSLHYGESGLVVPANTAETLIGSEIRIPGGFMRPGDWLVESGYVLFGGTLTTANRNIRTKISATPSLGTGAANLTMVTFNSGTNVGAVLDRPTLLTSNTQRRSQPNTILNAGASNSGYTDATLPDIGADVYIRPSVQNADVGSMTMTLYNYVLWLERSAP